MSVKNAPNGTAFLKNKALLLEAVFFPFDLFGDVFALFDCLLFNIFFESFLADVFCIFLTRKIKSFQKLDAKKLRL